MKNENISSNIIKIESYNDIFKVKKNDNEIINPKENNIKDPILKNNDEWKLIIPIINLEANIEERYR